jgi:hypothetical protein
MSMQEDLARLLDGYEARRRADVAREQRSKDDEAEFIAQFAALRREVIVPVFEEAGAMLEQRGHRHSIQQQEFTASPAGHIVEASVSLRVVPSGTKAALHADQPSLTIATRHYNKSVWINSGESNTSGGIAGAKGAHALQAITRQLVEDEVVAFIGRVVAS